MVVILTPIVLMVVGIPGSSFLLQEKTPASTELNSSKGREKAKTLVRTPTNKKELPNEPRKKPGLTFHYAILYWLIHRNPYFMVYEIVPT